MHVGMHLTGIIMINQMLYILILMVLNFETSELWKGESMNTVPEVDFIV